MKKNIKSKKYKRFIFNRGLESTLILGTDIHHASKIWFNSRTCKMQGEKNQCRLIKAENAPYYQFFILMENDYWHHHGNLREE